MRSVGESAYEKTIVGASILLRLGSTSPATLPLAIDFAQLDIAGATFELACGCSCCANRGGSHEEDVGEVHLEEMILR